MTQPALDNEHDICTDVSMRSSAKDQLNAYMAAWPTIVVVPAAASVNIPLLAFSLTKLAAQSEALEINNTASVTLTLCSSIMVTHARSAARHTQINQSSIPSAS